MKNLIKKLFLGFVSLSFLYWGAFGGVFSVYAKQPPLKEKSAKTEIHKPDKAEKVQKAEPPKTKKEPVKPVKKNKETSESVASEGGPVQVQESSEIGIDGDVSTQTEDMVASEPSFNEAGANDIVAQTMSQMGSPEDFIDVDVQNLDDVMTFSGDTGNTGEISISANDGEALITTGKAEVIGDVLNKANTNITQTPSHDEDTSTEVGNTNKGIVENFFDFFGNSGRNKISGSDGSGLIDTGDVEIKLNLLNLTNTNITNSKWGQYFFKADKFFEGEVNLEEAWHEADHNDCLMGRQCEGEFKLTNVNETEVYNKVKVLGVSGENQIQDIDGDGVIRTGDVKVGANLVNFLNTNITGGEWNMAVVNIFEDWQGDLVLPGKRAFDDNEGNYSLFANTILANSNDAQVKNDVVIETKTGENVILDNDGTPQIITGQASSKSNVSTIGNINFTGGDWFLVFVNTFGGWKGYVISKPEEIGFEKTDQGLVFSSLLSEAVKGSFTDDEGSLEVNNQNIASLNNEILIQALTGGNQINGNDGDAKIETGTAEVLSNILNFVNTNIFGGDWSVALVNVFGFWEGDIVFGRPELSLESAGALSQTPFAYGQEAGFKIVYENTGSADATQVEIRASFDPEVWQFKKASNKGNLVSPGEIVWHLDKIAIGDVGELNYFLVNQATQPGVFSSPLAWEISSFEKESDLDNNSITQEVQVQGQEVPENELTEQPTQDSPAANNQENPSPQESNDHTSSAPAQDSSEDTSQDTPSSSSQGQTQQASSQLSSSGGSITYSVSDLARLQVEKTNNSQGVVRPGQEVSYQIILKNTGDLTIDQVVVFDQMKNDKGEVLSEDQWQVGTIKPGKGVKIEYQVPITEKVPQGVYTNEVLVSGSVSGQVIKASDSSVITVQGQSLSEEISFSDESSSSALEQTPVLDIGPQQQKQPQDSGSGQNLLQELVQKPAQLLKKAQQSLEQKIEAQAKTLISQNQPLSGLSQKTKNSSQGVLSGSLTEKELVPAPSQGLALAGVWYFLAWLSALMDMLETHLVTFLTLAGLGIIVWQFRKNVVK